MAIESDSLLYDCFLSCCLGSAVFLAPNFSSLYVLFTRLHIFFLRAFIVRCARYHLKVYFDYVRVLESSIYHIHLLFFQLLSLIHILPCCCRCWCPPLPLLCPLLPLLLLLYASCSNNSLFFAISAIQHFMENFVHKKRLFMSPQVAGASGWRGNLYGKRPRGSFVLDISIRL